MIGLQPSTPPLAQPPFSTSSQVVNRGIEADSLFIPEAMYLKEWDATPPKGVIQKISFEDGYRVGAIVDDDGRPLKKGMIRLDKQLMSGLLQVNKLADTETAVREDEIGEVYRAVAAGLKAKEPKATAKATADGKMVAAEESTEVDGNVAEGKDELDAAAAATKASVG